LERTTGGEGPARERTRRAADGGGGNIAGTVTDSRRLATLAALAASSKQAVDIAVLDVRELITITDYFVIVTGASERQVDGIADGVVRDLKEAGVRPVRREGSSGERWQLVDFVDFVVHVFHEEEREYYRLETLWGDAPTVDWEHELQAS
jgi:ribosome-associated protein